MHKKVLTIYSLLAIALVSLLFVAGCGNGSNGNQSPQEVVYEESN